MLVSDLLEKTAAHFNDRPAVINLERSITFGELYRYYSVTSGHLKSLDLDPGSRIGLLYENSIEYVYLFFAIIDAGYVVVPLDTSIKPRKINYILKDCTATLLIYGPRFKRHLQNILLDNSTLKHLISTGEPGPVPNGTVFSNLNDILAEAEPNIATQVSRDSGDHIFEDAADELAAIFYTSGSTGIPKGVMLSHRNLISNTIATMEYLKLTQSDSVMVILPFYYIYGNSLMLTHIACGGTLVIDNRFMYPEVILDNMEKSKVTGFSGVPSNFMILLNNSTFAKRELKHLRYVTQAGGAMAPEVIRKLMKAFPDKEIFIMYGQTEASPRATYLPPEKLKDKIGSIGIPVPGVEITIVDDNGREIPNDTAGEIVISGPNVMLGYWNQSDEQEQVLKDGKLYSGDLGKKDKDGYIYVIGRKKEIIKTGGNRVSVKEIEERILAFSKVSEVAVFGVDDDLLGEAIKAVIVTKPGQDCDDAEIRKFCRVELADHKIPKHIVFMSKLPKYQTGKIDKIKLAEIHNH
jgi:acyl-CoA synthetase (AMP-forming)/AMP-acid ligase II